MPLVFTKPQIRRYLTEMGYENVDDDQLNEFIKDLKKLIKHDEKARKARNLAEQKYEQQQTSVSGGPTGHLDDAGAISSDSGSLHSLNETTVDSTRTSAPRSDLRRRGEAIKTSEYHSNRQHQQHHRSRSYSHLDIRSRVEEIKTSEQRAHTHHERHQHHHHTSHSEPEGTNSDHANHRNLPLGPNSLRSLNLTSSSGSKSGSLPTTGSSVSIDSGSSDQDSERRKPKLNIPDYIKRDPVALYHYYNSYWTKHKPPGSDRRMQLRWNVRAGTLGRVPCTPCGERINYLTR